MSTLPQWAGARRDRPSKIKASISARFGRNMVEKGATLEMSVWDINMQHPSTDQTGRDAG
jgi:hypothetical protein